MDDSKNAPTVIPFSHASPQQSFRLLELPPELLELLESGSGNGPGNGPVLHLKSSAPQSTITTSSSSSPAASTDFVNLCTPTQTYPLRQVHSSNSIFVIHPFPSQPERQRVAATADADGVAALGLCKSTLEVRPLKNPDGALHSAFRRALGIYDRPDAEADAEAADIDDDDNSSSSSSSSSSGDARTLVMQRFFADMPFSSAECARAWATQCAFVHHNRGQEVKESTGGLKKGLMCWRPTARLGVFVWKTMLEAAAADGIDLTRQFLTKDLWAAVLEFHGATPPFPRGVFDAVVRRLMEGEEGVDSSIKWVNLDGAKIVSWVGEVYLEATAPNLGSRIALSKYFDAWKDLLLERLRDEAALDKLQNRYQIVDGSSICFKQAVET